MKKLLIAVSIVLTVGIASTVYSYIWYRNSIGPVATPEKNYTLVVSAGDSVDQVLSVLENNNIIQNKLAAKIYLKFNPSIIQAGRFSLNTDMNVEQVLLILSDAKDETIWVTIPEGLRYDEIAELWAAELEEFDTAKFNLLAKTKILSRDTAEGYLFPDTYNIKKNVSEEEIFDLMYENFQSKVGEVSYNTLILASIVEREAKADEERPIVAGILKKRLDTAGWLLQADATLLYEYKDWKKDVSQELQTSKSMYNTYYNPDLPPTPICNPGLKSIDAARNPEIKTPYWFYLHGKDGIIRYAITQSEHNQNIYNYIW